MFTGIVEEMGTLKAIRKGPHSAVLEIQAKVVLEDIHFSIAVNGSASIPPPASPPTSCTRPNRSTAALRPGTG